MDTKTQLRTFRNENLSWSFGTEEFRKEGERGRGIFLLTQVYQQKSFAWQDWLMGMAKLDHRHHTFIQAFMTRGPLPEADAKAMFAALFRQENAGEGFGKFVTAINKEMNFVQMELRAGRNQYDGLLYYGLVNKLGNEQAKLGTRYSHAQIAFFKAVLESIISDPSSDGRISCIQALNLRIEVQNEQQATADASTPSTQTSMVNLTLAQREKALTEFAQDRWLSRSEDGMVTLGVRSFLELWNVFKNYDVPFCDICNEAGIKAQSCQNEDCPVRMHEYCLKIKFHRPQVPKVCPKCGTDWNAGVAPASKVEQDWNEEHTEYLPVISPHPKRPRSSHRTMNGR